MPLFKRKTGPSKVTQNDNSWDDWKQHVGEKEGVQQPSSALQGGSSTRPAPRSILRISSYGQDLPTGDRRRQSMAATASPSQVDPTSRDRFQSLPASNTASAIPASQSTGRSRASTSLPRSDVRGPASYKYDPESDRLDRACGQGAFAPVRPPHRTLSKRNSRASGGSRSRSRSMSHNGQTRQNGLVPRFPTPPVQQAIRDLSRIMRDRTKHFRLKDYLEPEELASGRIWEEEEETLVDCVRDRVDDEDGEDGVWRVEKKQRQMRRQADREMTRRQQSVFGAHLQDLTTTAMARVAIGGYAHIVPMIADACIEELYRTGVYKPNLFQALPNRERLLQLVARFDQAPSRTRANSITPTSEMKVYAKTQSLRNEQTPDVCALLVTYLSALPDTLIHRSLSDALWAWCVSPSIIRQEQRLCRRDDDASESEYETSEDEEENGPSYNARLRQMELDRMDLPSLKVQILLAQQVLLLLPPRHFSLLVHLMTFFATLLICPENGMSSDDIARIFGPTVVGGMTRKRNKHEAQKDMERSRGEKDEKEKKIMMWLLNNWERVSTAYEVDEDRGNMPKRTRSASVGDELDGPRRGSQGGRTADNRRDSVKVSRDAGHEIDDTQQRNRNTSGQCDNKRHSKDEHRPSVSGSLTSTSTNERYAARPRSGSLQIPKGKVEDRRSSVPSSLTSGSSASSSNLDLEQVQDTVPPVGPAKQQLTDIRVRTPKEHLPGSVSELIKSRRGHSEFVGPDDGSVYSDDGNESLYGVIESYLNEPTGPPAQPKTRTFLAVPEVADTPSAPEALPISPERKNPDLQKQLEQVLKERDEARDMVAAMRRIIQGTEP